METSWWYQGRAQAIRAALRKAREGVAERALDYGAGYGGSAALFTEIAKQVDAFEPEEVARSKAEKRGYKKTFASEAEAFATQYNLMGLFDVLEHIEDDRAFLLRAHAALVPGGTIVLTVPAFQALWSAHDVEHHHYRRYTTGALRSLLERAGYEIAYASYWNCALLFPAALLRLLGRSGEGGLSPHPVLNSNLMLIVRIEAAVLRFLPLPFGLSIVLVARKKHT
jgi:SAM-dependent methyltransferase